MNTRTRSLNISHSPENYFVYIPKSLEIDYIERVLSKYFNTELKINRYTATNLCSKDFWGTACSGATVVKIDVVLSNGKSMSLVAKILSPDPVNLFKIDCKYDSRIGEIRWAKWWGNDRTSLTPILYDTHMDIPSREFWILREYFPNIGWKDVTVSNWGKFKIDQNRLVNIVNAVAELHATSSFHIDELQSIHPIGQARELSLTDLEKELDCIIADVNLFRIIGIGNEEREKLKNYREFISRRPNWLEDWQIVCITADIKPDNFGFREQESEKPIFLDFGAARLAPIEEELTLFLSRVDADDSLVNNVLAIYVDQYNRHAKEKINFSDLKRRLPWAEPILYLQSLIWQANALRWVPHQDRSKSCIRYFIKSLGPLFERCQLAP